MSEVNIDAALLRDGGANLSCTEEQLVEPAMAGAAPDKLAAGRIIICALNPDGQPGR